MYPLMMRIKFLSIYKYCLLFVALSGLLTTQSIFAQAIDKNYPVVRTPEGITANKKMPENILSPGEQVPVYFSKNPTDEEIFKVHFFEEPLVPVAGTEITGENADLVFALANFSQRKTDDDFSSILNFLESHPSTRWRGALLSDLGILYRRTGYYDEALRCWTIAWNILKPETEAKVKLLADKVLSELLLINAWVGRLGQVDSLLKQIDQRIIKGPSNERIANMKRASWLMKNRPEVSFMCGPYALNRLRLVSDTANKRNNTLTQTIKSTPKGFSLSELQQMASNAGMKYQMAFRNPGATVILNAVVHWKLEHYSALLKLENGHYQCEDATMGTYGKEFWLTAAALDSSASGYFLVPIGALPAGWRKVSIDEGSKIFGKGNEPTDPGKHVTANDIQLPQRSNDPSHTGNFTPIPVASGQSCPVSPMAQSNVHASAVSLHIFDSPVYYTPPVGPVMIWDVNYHHKDSYQPANFSYSNMGPKWTFNWLSYVVDNPAVPSAAADVYVLGGGTRTFVSYNATTSSYAPELQTNDVLVRICPTCYELRHPDGSKEVYSRPDGSTAAGRKVFLTKRVDASGNAMNVLYDNNLRMVGLRDTLGQITVIGYENSDMYKITRVTDPFGRSAGFSYDSEGRLNRIVDMIGIVSTFEYDQTDFINKMTTPYGTTAFSKADGAGNFRSLQTSYAMGESEKVIYADDPGITGVDAAGPVSDFPGAPFENIYLNFRNTFFWDKKAMKEGPNDYSKARIYHWLHGSPNSGEDGSAAPVLESIKDPLESRIWFLYENQNNNILANQGMSAGPSMIGRVLDDGTPQITTHSYNAFGADTLSTDPRGRKLRYIYDTSKINLLEVRQVKNNANELLAKFTYNTQHLPLTSVDAADLTSYFTYNTVGQLLTAKNPRNEITTLAYDANGYLQNITGPLAGSTVSFTYDGFGRVRTVTDPEGYKITTDYDALDRPTLVTYPDSTYEQIVYDRLEAVHMRDRLGRWSHTIYDSLRRPNAMQDALGRITQLIWCSCGSISEIVDPLKNVTSFTRDLQGRVTFKTYPDGKKIAYTYEAKTSRLKEVVDAKGQKTQYSYFIDNNLKQVDYVNAQVATPSVSYTYDSVYNRMWSMTDGSGTTNYTYNTIASGLGSGQLATVDGPLANDIINYTYDSLGRVNNRSINGSTASVVYDHLGRISSAVNALGSFTYNYLNQTERIASIIYPNGQTTSFGYLNNHDDQRLSEIWNKTSAAVTISKFNYDYNKEGQITKWTQQAGTATPTYLEIVYDLADQLISATQKNQSNSAIVKRYAYQYDKSGNRISEQIDNTVTSSSYNNVNQLTAQQNTGRMRFKGTVNEFSTVLVKNLTAADSAYAAVDTTNTYEAFVKTVTGTNNIAVKATDYSGNNNTATNNYSIAVTAGTTNSLTYDNNGNTLASATPAVSYDWDAVDRLVKITQGANITEFVYDGLSRRVAEKLNGTIIKRWLWDGTELAEERDAGGGTVTKRFFAQGEQLGATKYFFTKDHLGSVREMTDINGNTITRYDYDPYGRRTRVLGSVDADFGFTGHYYHTQSGMYLTLYRAYDVNKGRWISRDPIQEAGGSNLYSYAMNNPMHNIDPLGLKIMVQWHEVGLGYYHTLITITPNNQSRYYNDPRFNNLDNESHIYATIGAGPSSGKLKNGINRPNDAKLHSGGYEINCDSENEDALIEKLFLLNSNYSQDLDYDLFADTPENQSFFIPDDGYNSNSYISGLLDAAGVSKPKLDKKVYPGWNKPVPASKFSIFSKK